MPGELTVGLFKYSIDLKKLPLATRVVQKRKPHHSLFREETERFGIFDSK